MRALKPSQRFLLQGMIGAAGILLYGLIAGAGLQLRIALTFLIVFPVFRYAIAWALGRV